MRRAVRIGLVALGAAMAVYGAASQTGGWLGTPPWWAHARTYTAADVESAWCAVWHCSPRTVKRIREQRSSPPAARVTASSPGVAGSAWPGEGWRWAEPDESVQFEAALRSARPERGFAERRDSISGGLVAAGLALVAVAAWPRPRAKAAS